MNLLWIAQALVVLLAGIVGAVVATLFALTCLLCLMAFAGEMASRYLLMSVFGALPILAGIPILGAIGGASVLSLMRSVPSTEEDRRKKRRALAGIFIGIPGAFAFVIALGYIHLRPPMDRSMLRHFELHETRFNAIVKYVSANRLTRLGQFDVKPAGIAPESLATPREWLEEVKAQRGLTAAEDARWVNFGYWDSDSDALKDFIAKGFEFRLDPPKNLLKSLEGVRPDDPKRDFIAYRHIRGNWYLYYRTYGEDVSSGGRR